MINNLESLQKQIMSRFIEDLTDVLKGSECKRYFFKMMTQSIEEEVYDRYEPKQYDRRRDNKGLTDEENYLYEVDINKDGIKIFMKNMTTGKGRAFMIDEGIVEGVNFYDWDRSEIYILQQNGGFPRDFYTYMEILVEDDDTLKSIIKKQMSKKGWK